MEITETMHQSLRREFRITVGVSDLDEKLKVRLDGIKDQVTLKGFAPARCRSRICARRSASP